MAIKTVKKDNLYILKILTAKIHCTSCKIREGSTIVSISNIREGGIREEKMLDRLNLFIH